MAGSKYIQDIRNKIGNSLILIPSVGGIILNEKNEILLQEKHDNSWSLPAGMIEPNETPKEAIIREVKEETGFIVEPITVLGILGGSDFNYIYPNQNEVGYTVILMLCSVKSKSDHVLDKETKSLQYFSKENMPKLALPYPKDVLFNEFKGVYIS